MLKTYQTATAVLMLCALASCASLNDSNFQAKLATQYATLKIVDDDPVKAARVQEIATQVQQYASNEALLTVDLLVAEIGNQVPWQSLDAADELLLRALLDQLRFELTERLGADPLPDNVRLAADTVATWVIEASEFI